MTAVPATGRARATRDALVTMAGRMFEESGYTRVAVRDLARRSGCTTGAVYGHFRNKADLLAAAITNRIERELEGPRYGPGSIADYLARQWRDYRARAGLRALLIEGAAAARVDPDVRATIGALHEAKLAQWRAVYRAVQEAEGDLPGIDTDTLVTFLWATELGLGVLEAAEVTLPRPGDGSTLLRHLLGPLQSESGAPGRLTPDRAAPRPR